MLTSPPAAGALKGLSDIAYNCRAQTRVRGSEWFFLRCFLCSEWLEAETGLRNQMKQGDVLTSIGLVLNGT